MRFDDQAGEFDRRAGLPLDARTRIATAVVERARLGVGDVLLEVGAGTGEIGVELARLAPGYRGFDVSAPMLEELSRRVGPEAPVDVVCADANGRWPADDGSVRAVFGSRVMHLLEPEHVVDEVRRVAGPCGLVLLVGRVRRDPASVRAQMRRRMRELVAEEGVAPRETGPRRLLGAFGERGARPLEPAIGATWRVEHSPQLSLEGWAGKSGLAGRDVDDAVKTRVLERLRAWAVDRFGRLDQVFSSEEEYVIDGVELELR